jgi:hypothetical protein
MEQDAEAAGLASAGALSSGRHHPVVAGRACENCGTPVSVRYCTSCGQLGADFHRPVWDLVGSSIADMFSLDGRLWHTLPPLMLRPGRMTRDYILGKRARFVPPFRLFLLTSVIFFLTVFTVLEHQPWMKELRLNPNSQPSGEFVVGGDIRFNISAPPDTETLRRQLEAADLSEAERAQIEAALARLPEQGSLAPFILDNGTIDREALRASIAASNPGLTPQQLEAAQSTADRFANFYENQERFANRMKEWAPRFTLLFLPIFSALLALTYAWHRRRYFYDHMISGLHFQTFVYVLATLLVLASAAVPPFTPVAAALGPLLIFVYLWRMLRVTYDTGWGMAFLRTGFLLTAAQVILALLATGLVVLSFYLT